MFVSKARCDVNALGAENQSALHVATDEGYSVMVEILLDHGANVNSVDKDGDTALHIALAKESLLGTDLVSQMVNIYCYSSIRLRTFRCHTVKSLEYSRKKNAV